MNKKWIPPVSLVFLLLFWSVIAHAVETGNEEETGDMRSAVFARIAEATVDLKTVSSDFTQEKHFSMLKDTLVSRGWFAYERPDRLYWEIIKPSPAGFMANGAKARRWEGDLRKAETFDLQRDPVARAIVEQVFAWARADFPWLAKRYVITLSEKAPRLIRLRPLSSQEKKYISHLNLTFSHDWSHVGAVEIYEKGGDFTRITFSHTVLNEPLKKDLFTR
jgi:outer membrane lipoprotein-sorting protein